MHVLYTYAFPIILTEQSALIIQHLHVKSVKPDINSKTRLTIADMKQIYVWIIIYIHVCVSIYVTMKHIFMFQNLNLFPLFTVF